MPGSSINTGSDGGRLLVLEPYYGGSHRDFLDNLLVRLGRPFTLLTLPPRKWKWRMRLSSPYFARLLRDERLPGDIDAILCSTFVDVALLKSLLPRKLATVPIMVYYHENQFAYPVQVEMERDLHFAITNLTTALVADRLAFNSRYNLDTFLAGAAEMIKKVPDMDLGSALIAGIRAKSRVIHPGLDFMVADGVVVDGGDRGRPIVVWNHRWEHDKDPESFFAALMSLDRKGADFGLIVLGQAFSRCPEIFARAERELGRHIVHFGYAADRKEYFRLLARGDVVVSTAAHEFYGMAVFEAVRCGLRPLLPDDLAYPEFFGAEFLYPRGNLLTALEAAMARGRIGSGAGRRLTAGFSWDEVLGKFADWLASA